MPFSQADDFREETEALHGLIAPLDEAALRRRTQFKDWTIEDVVRHLHAWNLAADWSLRDPEVFADVRRDIVRGMEERKPIREIESGWIDVKEGPALVVRWRAFASDMADRFAEADPRRRVAWAGPDMSVRSSITARLMETWAHGQEVYDALGAERVDTDRIKNVAVLGVNTFAWTFRNRGLDVPEPVPHVRLTAPSGEIWEWNDPGPNRIEGSATEFCQVVTQTRNVADTDLVVEGDVSQRWMAIAQCFAGPPEEPPAPGTRRRSAE